MKRHWDPTTFTLGFELEVGDVDRSIEIPRSLGSWESSERDIVNLRPPYENVAADPLGLSPPVGGEVNVMPARDIGEMVDRIMNLLTLFANCGTPATACCTTHSHVHIRVPGLRDDIDALKRLMRYIRRNQELTVRICGGFREVPELRLCPGAKTYMKYDGGRLMPDWMIDNILEHAHDFDDFIRLHSAGRDPSSRGRPLRYAINTYCMKHIDTIEFRMFRSTLNRLELTSCLLLVKSFISAALNDGPDVAEVISQIQAIGGVFPQMRFSIDEWNGLQETKHPETRGKKVRTFHDI